MAGHFQHQLTQKMGRRGNRSYIDFLTANHEHHDSLGIVLSASFIEQGIWGKKTRNTSNIACPWISLPDSAGRQIATITPMKNAKIGIVTVSDRASRGEYEDLGGPAIRNYLNEVLSSPWEAVAHVISDDVEIIQSTLTKLCDDDGCCLVITTGGTGPSKRDVTPEATEAVCDRMMPGFGELMRQVSLAKVPTAILSRQTAGLRGASLIVNLPGKPKAIAECLDAVFPAVPYCVDLMDGPRLETDESRLVAFRPKGK